MNLYKIVSAYDPETLAKKVEEAQRLGWGPMPGGFSVTPDLINTDGENALKVIQSKFFQVLVPQLTISGAVEISAPSEQSESLPHDKTPPKNWRKGAIIRRGIAPSADLEGTSVVTLFAEYKLLDNGEFDGSEYWFKAQSQDGEEIRIFPLPDDEVRETWSE